MFAHVTGLRYWKSERVDLTTCEDALCYDVSRGLFCVADGAGTTLFSNLWADILVRQFAGDPLMSCDFFEMEWWIRFAQREYQTTIAPKLSKLDWSAKQKAIDQGAYSTLVALRVVQQSAQAMTAVLLAVGDSCALVGHMADERIEAFPLQREKEFERAPYCIPALLKNFNRYTLYPSERTIELLPDDVIILATDAVAHWIISGRGSGDESKAWKAFLEIAQRTEDDWPSFIDNARHNSALHDDDCTALIIQIKAEGLDDEQIRDAAAPRPETVERRREEFERAREKDDKELVAIIYGDGQMLQSVGVTLPEDKRAEARAVADALREVRQAMRSALNTANFAEKVAPVWWRHADRLMNESCADVVRKTLQSQGINLSRPVPSPARPANQDDIVLPMPPLPPRQPASNASGDNVIAQWLPPLTGTDPALATTIPPSALPPAAAQQLHARQNQAVQVTPDSDLINRLRNAMNRRDDGALIAIDEANKASSSPVEFLPFEIQTIEEARQRKAASQELQDVLLEGTARQMVDAADHPLLRKPLSLSLDQQEQLGLARALVEAIYADDDQRIADAYRDIEFSSLRKHFIFQAEDQQRIQTARDERATLRQFRRLLVKGGMTTAQLANAYDSFSSPARALNEDEQYVIHLADRFQQLYREVRQNQQSKNADQQIQLVQVYNALYYAPYQIAFIDKEARCVKNCPPVDAPAILMVNSVPVTISQLLVLRTIKLRYAELQITNVQKRLAGRISDTDHQYYERISGYWKERIDSGCSYEAILSDLISQPLLEEELQRIPRRGNARLDNEVRDLSNEILRELRASGVEPERELVRFLALYEVFSRYPPDSKTLVEWLKEQRRTQEIVYFERPEPGEQTTRERSRCWLFHWWRFRSSQNTVDRSGRA